jgi:hypothetical protein
MDRRLVSGLALAAGLAVAACTDQPQEQSLQEQSSVVSFVTPCNTNGFNSLIAAYFAGSQQNLVKGYKDAMLAALAANQPATAQTNGFNILREIALAAKGTPQPTASTGSALAVETLRCIVEVTSTDVIEATPGLDFFVEELNHAAGGGFEVRGGLGNPTGPVQAVVDGAVISGIAPELPETSTWWDAPLDGVPGQRVLFYGAPDGASETDPTPGYHWSVVPWAAEFDPPVVITTCVNDEDFNDPSLMLTETGVGVLAFEDASHICDEPEPVAAASGRFNLLRHLANLGRKLLTPEPASAAAVMPGLVGGSAKGVKSHFDVDAVTDLDVVPDPRRVTTLVVNSGTFDLTVTVEEDDRLVNGATVELSTGTNSGAFNFIHEQSNGTCSGDTPTKVTGSEFPTGTVTFNDLCITQTGYVTVFINVGFDERSGTGSASIPRIKVTPPPKK